MDKNSVKIVEPGAYDAEKYNLTTADAYEMLKSRKLSAAENPQVVQRWLKEGRIDAVQIKTGPRTGRGYRVNEKSLLQYAESLVKSAGEWQREVDDLKGQIAALEEKLRVYEDEKKAKAARTAKRQAKEAQKAKAVSEKPTPDIKNDNEQSGEGETV